MATHHTVAMSHTTHPYGYINIISSVVSYLSLYTSVHLCTQIKSINMTDIASCAVLDEDEAPLVVCINTRVGSTIKFVAQVRT